MTKLNRPLKAITDSLAGLVIINKEIKANSATHWKPGYELTK